MKQALEKLKPNKSDAVFNYSTDCFINAGENVIEALTLLFRSYLIHGYVPDVLMSATLVPLIKDKLGDINSSKNYRSIAISNILLKILDWIFLIISGDLFKLNDVQFAYQSNTSTSMCSWMVLETINYYLARGSKVYVCSMDYSKAFDRVLHGTLFTKMLDKGLSPIFLRLLLYIYMHQTAAVRWRDKVSNSFSMTNAVRQGAVSSAIFYCFYCEQLFEELKRIGVGCWVENLYHGIFGYSDDNILLAPTIEALQQMIKTCEDFARTHNLQFSTDPDPVKCKTKLICFSDENVIPATKVYLCGNVLPWVSNIKHVGIFLTSLVDGLQHDIEIKGAQYINTANYLNQEFSFAHPYTKWKLNMIYNFHFTGCELWDFCSDEFGKFLSTIQRSFKIAYDLPWATHRYYFEALTKCQHPLLIIRRRFLNFLDMIKRSKKVAPKTLLDTIQNDTRSVTGSNLRSIMLDSDEVSVNDIKIEKAEVYISVPVHEDWRIGVVSEIVDVIHNQAFVEDFERQNLVEIMNNLCIS